jgi:ATP-dependent helicase/nuclease subunit A
MAAYRAVLQAIFPDRPVLCALVWTTDCQVMELPESLLDRHAPSASPAA